MVSPAWAADAANPDPNRFSEQIDAFAAWDSKNAVPSEPILFVGSSSIRMWKTRQAFPDLPVINRGFGGSHISDVVYFSDRIVLPYRPKLIVLYAGDNDVAGGKSAAQVLCDYRRFVELVHAELPDTRIIFITIKPSGKRWSLWPRMNGANELIRSFSAKRGQRTYPLLLCQERSPLFCGPCHTTHRRGRSPRRRVVPQRQTPSQCQGLPRLDQSAAPRDPPGLPVAPRVEIRTLRVHPRGACPLLRRAILWTKRG
jgi:hypothetical protein